MKEFDITGPLPCVMCGSSDMVKCTIPYISHVISNVLACCWMKLERTFDCQESCEPFQKYIRGSRDAMVSNYLTKLMNGVLPEGSQRHPHEDRDNLFEAEGEPDLDSGSEKSIYSSPEEEGEEEDAGEVDDDDDDVDEDDADAEYEDEESDTGVD